jgi:pimeloyl-ACP methyl ester carboxylesterase
MWLTVAGRRTYAYTGGRQLDAQQPTLVFIHGAANDHCVFTLPARYFAWHGSNVLTLDLPGHGRSAGPPLATVDALADWIVALLDAAGVETATLIGHSLGSLVALHAAAAHPRRVRRVVLLGPAVPMAVSEVVLELARNDDHRALELINGWSYSAARRLGGSPVPGLWLAGNALRLMERAAPGVLHTDLMACHGYADGLASAARVRCPALLILGESDIMAPPRSAQALVAALPQARTQTLPGAGHALMQEEPDAVLDALRDFVGAAERRVQGEP